MRRPVPPQKRAARLGLEPLEAREVPAFVYAVTESQRLQAFDSATPTVLIGAVSLTGAVGAGEQITDIAVRPATGQLYGRSDQGRIYVIDPVTGGMAPISAQIAIGANVSMDFDPTSDLLWVVNYSGGNFAIDPNTGSPAVFGNQLSYVAGDAAQGQVPHLAGVSFTNSFPFAALTQEYGIDAARDTLVIGLNGPAGGTFATVGPLGIDVTGTMGFDFDPATNIAFASFQIAGTPSSVFSQVNTLSGAVFQIGTIGPSAALVRSIAVARANTAAGAILLPPPLSPPLIDPNFVVPNTTIPPLVTPSLTTPNVIPPLAIIPTSPLPSTLIQPLAPGIIGGTGSSFFVTGSTVGFNFGFGF